MFSLISSALLFACGVFCLTAALMSFVISGYVPILVGGCAISFAMIAFALYFYRQAGTKYLKRRDGEVDHQGEREIQLRLYG